jgi:hypothetical protein
MIYPLNIVIFHSYVSSFTRPGKSRFSLLRHPDFCCFETQESNIKLLWKTSIFADQLGSVGQPPNPHFWWKIPRFWGWNLKKTSVCLDAKKTMGSVIGERNFIQNTGWIWKFWNLDATNPSRDSKRCVLLTWNHSLGWWIVPTKLSSQTHGAGGISDCSITAEARRFQADFFYSFADQIMRTIPVAMSNQIPIWRPTTHISWWNPDYQGVSSAFWDFRASHDWFSGKTGGYRTYLPVPVVQHTQPVRAPSFEKSMSLEKPGFRSVRSIPVGWSGV